MRDQNWENTTAQAFLPAPPHAHTHEGTKSPFVSSLLRRSWGPPHCCKQGRGPAGALCKERKARTPATQGHRREMSQQEVLSAPHPDMNARNSRVWAPQRGGRQAGSPVPAQPGLPRAPQRGPLCESAGSALPHSSKPPHPPLHFWQGAENRNKPLKFGDSLRKRRARLNREAEPYEFCPATWAP